jgi:putative protein kinase ArgK-like GTPase of G3E family
VTVCSAIQNEGIDAIWDIILEYIETTTMRLCAFSEQKCSS